MMTENVKTPLRTFARLGYTKMETAALVDKMNKLLANYAVHYQKLRSYHWNVKGGDFFDVHEKFEDQYNEAQVVIDQIAERIRVFGQTPTSTLKEFLELSEIKETTSTITALEMVKEIVRDYELLLEHMFDVIETAIENGDSGTEYLMKSFIVKLEKNHWMMSSFVAEQH